MAKFKVVTDQGTFTVDADIPSEASSPPENQKPEPKKPGILGQAWQDLALPEQKAKEGLGMITQGEVGAQNWLANKTGLPIGTEPTGNMARDIIANVPRIAGETLQQTAPSFVSRGAIATAGLLKGASKIAPLLEGPAGWVARQAEAGSGLENKGKELLGVAYEDPTLMFGPGRKAANAMYDEIQAGNKMIRPSLVQTSNPIDFINKAIKYGKDGSLTSDEALEARKLLDGMRDNVTRPFYDFVRSALDEVAKRDYSGADAAYAKATQSEALRGLSSWNKTGGQSKTTLGAMLFKRAAAIPYSPIVQSSIASGLGAGAQLGAAALANRPVIAGAYGVADQIQNLLNRRNSNGK